MLLAVVFIFSIGYLNTFAYATPFDNCPNTDCWSANPGTLLSGTSSFPYASWDQHQRNADYHFHCDNCDFDWEKRLSVIENHEFVNRRCECGYYAYK